MNYIILNGKKSTLIKGLLIQSLPAITKPLMRTNTFSVDGRDGDFVTKLGYSAYDKTMSIGLFGDFDIDEVIEYFDSEGTVIFSNEPDKFYNYQILKQIDFERLATFRTAQIVLHVQPFKYSAVDDSFTASNEILSLITNTTLSSHGVDLLISNNQILLSGTPDGIAPEFFVPIKQLRIEGEYTFETIGAGFQQGDIVRLINELPTDADSFGNTSVSTTGQINATLSSESEFNYVYLKLTPNNGTPYEYNANLLCTMTDEDFDGIKVINRGNIESKPTLTIYGSGEVDLFINGTQILTLTLTDYITIDSARMNAYKGDTLMNRYVSGNYNNVVLNQGTNQITWSGTVTAINVQNESRWI